MYLRTAAVLALIVSFPLLANAQESPRYPSLDADEIEELNDGEILVDTERSDNVNRGDVYGLVTGSIDDLWAIVQDFDDLDRWFPDMNNTERQSGDVGQGETNMPWPIADRHWQINLSNHGLSEISGRQCYSATWTYVEGSGNVDDTFGFWLLCPWDDNPEQVLVRYVINADLGVWLPNPVIRWATGRLLPGAVEGLQERYNELH